MSKLPGSGARVICLIDRATHNNSINESCDFISIPSLGADSGREDLPVANDAAQYLHPVRTGSRSDDPIGSAFDCKACDLLRSSPKEELRGARVAHLSDNETRTPVIRCGIDTCLHCIFSGEPVADDG